MKNEEERFHETLHDGEAILAEVIAKEEKQLLFRVDAFRLYDTYGFPIELTEEYAEEAGMTVDHEGFENEMENNVSVHVPLVKTLILCKFKVVSLEKLK